MRYIFLGILAFTVFQSGVAFSEGEPEAEGSMDGAAAENTDEATPKSSSKKTKKNLPPKRSILDRLDSIQARLVKIEADLALTTEEEEPGSEENREGKRFDILVGASFIDYKIVKANANEYTTQFATSYYVRPDTKVGLAYRSGRFKFDQSGSASDLSADTKGFSLFANYFLGNSIKFNAGFHSNSIEFEGGSELNIQSIGLGFGNQWNWESFVIAWDWLNYEHVLKAKQGPLDLKDDLKDRLLLSSFSLGWAF